MADIESRVHKYRKFIVRCIKGPELLSWLIPRIQELHGNVGNRLKQRLSSDDTSANVSPVDELIDIIIMSTEPGKWKTFIDGLQQSDYPYLASILEARSAAARNVDYEQKIIQLFAPDLEKHIIPGEILSELYSKNIINSTDKENILARERTHGPTAATVVLLDRMQCRTDPKFWYPAFLGLLIENGYRKLVNEVDPDFVRCYKRLKKSEETDKEVLTETEYGDSSLSLESYGETASARPFWSDVAPNPDFQAGSTMEDVLHYSSTTPEHSLQNLDANRPEKGCVSSTEDLEEGLLSMAINTEVYPNAKKRVTRKPINPDRTRKPKAKSSKSTEITIEGAVIKGQHKYQIAPPVTSPPARLSINRDTEYTNVGGNIYAFFVSIPDLDAFQASVHSTIVDQRKCLKLSDVVGKSIGHAPSGFSLVFHKLLEMNCSIFAETTGEPTPSFPPWPLPRERGGGVVIPCNYVVSCDKSQAKQIYQILFRCLENMPEGTAMKLRFS